MFAVRRAAAAAVRVQRWPLTSGAVSVYVRRAMSSLGSADRELRVDMLQDDFKGQSVGVVECTRTIVSLSCSAVYMHRSYSTVLCLCITLGPVCVLVLQTLWKNV